MVISHSLRHNLYKNSTKVGIFSPKQATIKLNSLVFLFPIVNFATYPRQQ